MITMIEFNDKNMELNEASLFMQRFFKQCNVQYIDFTIDENIESSLEKAIHSCKNISDSNISFVLNISSNINPLLGRNEFSEAINKISNTIDALLNSIDNIYIITSFGGQLILKCDYILAVNTFGTQYCLSVTKNNYNTFTESTALFSIDNEGLIYFNPMCIRCITNMQKYIFGKDTNDIKYYKNMKILNAVYLFKPKDSNFHIYNERHKNF